MKDKVLQLQLQLKIFQVELYIEVFEVHKEL